jgi:hypothetical protein
VAEEQKSGKRSTEEQTGGIIMKSYKTKCVLKKCGTAGGNTSKKEESAVGIPMSSKNRDMYPPLS